MHVCCVGAGAPEQWRKPRCVQRHTRHRTRRCGHGSQTVQKVPHGLGRRLAVQALPSAGPRDEAHHCALQCARRPCRARATPADDGWQEHGASGRQIKRWWRGGRAGGGVPNNKPCYVGPVSESADAGHRSAAQRPPRKRPAPMQACVSASPQAPARPPALTSDVHHIQRCGCAAHLGGERQRRPQHVDMLPPAAHDAQGALVAVVLDCNSSHAGRHGTARHDAARHRTARRVRHGHAR